MHALDLNLDEVIHIRTVLTKAELEGLPLEGTLKDDVEKGKVGLIHCSKRIRDCLSRPLLILVPQICFLCMKTRFSFFTWGVRCQLCKQQVCAKCSSKVSGTVAAAAARVLYSFTRLTLSSPQMAVPHDHFSSFSAATALRGNNPHNSNTLTASASTSALRRKSAPNSPETARRRRPEKATRKPKMQVSEEFARNRFLTLLY